MGGKELFVSPKKWEEIAGLDLKSDMGFKALKDIGVYSEESWSPSRIRDYESALDLLQERSCLKEIM